MLIPLKDVITKYALNLKGVIHLGASYGQERDIYNELGLQVLWVEAIPEVFEQLKKNIEPYPNQKAMYACIGSMDGEEKIFHVSNNEGQSSSYLPLGTHKIAHPEVHYTRSFVINAIRVDTLVSALNLDINEEWLLMADLQGAEMEALISCGVLLKKFGAIYLEVNKQQLYEGCALKCDIEDFLFGYGYIHVEEFMYEQWGWGDEFFIKSDLLV
jgi:FkbM family methyltransferase